MKQYFDGEGRKVNAEYDTEKKQWRIIDGVKQYYVLDGFFKREYRLVPDDQVVSQSGSAYRRPNFGDAFLMAINKWLFTFSVLCTIIGIVGLYNNPEGWWGLVFGFGVIALTLIFIEAYLTWKTYGKRK